MLALLTEMCSLLVDAAKSNLDLALILVSVFLNTFLKVLHLISKVLSEETCAEIH